MDHNNLKFNLAVRGWAEQQNLPVRHSGSDEKLIIQYATPDLVASWSQDEIIAIQNDISQKIEKFANMFNVNYELQFCDLGYGELAAVILIKELSRKNAAEQYYNLINLGPNMTPEQFLQISRLKKKFGFA